MDIVEPITENVARDLAAAFLQRAQHPRWQ